MNKTKLFNNAIKAIDNYNKAVEMDFPQSYIDLLDKCPCRARHHQE